MKVYVTGMGAATSLGIGVDTVFSNLLAGKTGIRAYPEWEKHNGLNSRIGAPVPDYDIMKIPRSARRTMSRMSELAVLSTVEALQHADLQIGNHQSTPRILICMGSTTGSPDTLETYFRKLYEKNGFEGQVSTTFFKVMNHSVPANVASALGFRGPSFSPSSACATSAQAMILGWELMQTGLYDIVIAGGADELHYTTSAVFDVVHAASRGYNDRPEQASRPFDLARDGLVVSEGASTVILETEASAKARGVRRHAEFMGGAYLCDGSHMSQSSTSTMVDVMRSSLERSKLGAHDIGYVNAHATATVHGDQAEAAAIGEVFGKNVPVSSLKGHFGHCMAACGSLEAIASIKMMESGTLIPTRNLDTIDPACAQVLHLQEVKPVKVRHVLSNNFAFGGMNTSLVLSRVDN